MGRHRRRRDCPQWSPRPAASALRCCALARATCPDSPLRRRRAIGGERAVDAPRSMCCRCLLGPVPRKRHVAAPLGAEVERLEGRPAKEVGVHSECTCFALAPSTCQTTRSALGTGLVDVERDNGTKRIAENGLSIISLAGAGPSWVAPLSTNRSIVPTTSSTPMWPSQCGGAPRAAACAGRSPTLMLSSQKQLRQGRCKKLAPQQRRSYGVRSDRTCSYPTRLAVPRLDCFTEIAVR